VKTVVSVSLGSARGDFDIEATLGGVLFRLRRVGTEGDLEQARRVIERLDGHVDAIGLGGANLAYRVGPRLYACRDGQTIARVARRTPVVDGSGFKDTFERGLPAYLERNGVQLRGKKVLLISALDRWGLGEALEAAGATVMVGDAVFALGLPVLFPGLRWFAAAAGLTMWGLCRLPLRRLYPIGAAQEARTPGFAWVWRSAAVVAGDFHFIRRYMPHSLQGKIIVTTSTTAQDRDLLRERGARAVCTMVSPLEGRTFGANVLDASAVAAVGRFPLNREDYVWWWQRAGLEPHIEWF
jgi:hypothetical protein